jgi:hypothetical protein
MRNRDDNVLVAAHVYRGDEHGEAIIRIISARKWRSVRSDDIRHKRWTKAELDATRHIARESLGDDSGVNCDENPRLTDEQLTRMVRLRNVRPQC